MNNVPCFPNSEDIFYCLDIVQNCGYENTVSIIYLSTMKSFSINYFNEIKKPRSWQSSEYHSP